MTLTATATAHSALSTWDETIVPALRKRLESESRILAKRMSIASMSSTDDPPPSPAPSRPLDVPRVPPETTKYSAIPRPSLQYSRTTTDARSDASSSYTRLNGVPATPSLPSKRARTYSQPPSPNSFAHNQLPTSDHSRPTSPRTSDVKPTRIPIAARTRTTSASSHAHTITHRANSRNGANHRPHQPPTPDTSQEPWIVKSSEPQPTTLPMAPLRHQPSNIMNESPPFSTSFLTSSMRSRKQDPSLPDPRPSNDSEERPFEHWYRGDVHRNGGVGELRVAKHVEMLQIANYGHNLRNSIRGQTRDLSGPVETTRGRKRADSVGAGTHESLYLDDEPTEMVLDESPLTDIEDDHDTDAETFYDAYAGVDADADADDTIRFSVSTPRPPLTMVSTARSGTPTRPSLVLDRNSAPKQPTQTASGPLRSGTPSALPRASAESMPTPKPSAKLRSRSMSSTTPPRVSQSSDQSHNKRRAKSPATSSPTSPAKKAKPKAKTLPIISPDPRNSIAVYPTPEGDMVNAIPTWTQPVQKSGNWDEVVLPVVARKKGLNGQYEQADGSPKPISPPPVKPAPGTFGYDYTKYRPPLRRDEEISMVEFGHIPEHTTIPEKVYVPSRPAEPPKPIPQPIIQPEEPIRPNPRKAFPNPPNSPAPFSQYRMEPQVPTINVTRPSTEFVNRQRQEQEQDDVTGGCCKCVIM